MASHREKVKTIERVYTFLPSDLVLFTVIFILNNVYNISTQFYLYGNHVVAGVFFGHLLFYNGLKYTAYINRKQYSLLTACGDLSTESEHGCERERERWGGRRIAKEEDGEQATMAVAEAFGRCILKISSKIEQLYLYGNFSFIKYSLVFHSQFTVCSTNPFRSRK